MKMIILPTRESSSGVPSIVPEDTATDFSVYMGHVSSIPQTTSHLKWVGDFPTRAEAEAYAASTGYEVIQ